MTSGPQDVIKDMKRRFKFMNHQIEQLKDEITIMDHCLVRSLVFPLFSWLLRRSALWRTKLWLSSRMRVRLK